MNLTSFSFLLQLVLFRLYFSLANVLQLFHPHLCDVSWWMVAGTYFCDKQPVLTLHTRLHMLLNHRVPTIFHRRKEILEQNTALCWHAIPVSTIFFHLVSALESVQVPGQVYMSNTFDRLILSHFLPDTHSRFPIQERQYTLSLGLFIVKQS